MSDGYAADTVMRQPGYFRLQARALQGVLTIRQPNSARSTSSNHARAPWTPSQHTIRAFDGAPRRISFTWAGHTTSNQRVQVATESEQLQAEAERRAQDQGMPIEQSFKHQDLRTIANLADDQVRIKHQAAAPHSAARSGSVSAASMGCHHQGNLPVFVLAGEAEPKVSTLRNVDRGARGRQRGDVKARAEVWAERNLYLLTDGQRPQDSARPALLTLST